MPAVVYAAVTGPYVRGAPAPVPPTVAVGAASTDSSWLLSTPAAVKASRKVARTSAVDLPTRTERIPAAADAGTVITYATVTVPDAKRRLWPKRRDTVKVICTLP